MGEKISIMIISVLVHSDMLRRFISKLDMNSVLDFVYVEETT